MVSRDYNKYEHIVHWPNLKIVKERGSHNKWHFDEPTLSCLKSSRTTIIPGKGQITKVWITESLEKNRLYLLDKSGNEIKPGIVCETCAGKVMRLLKWSRSDDGNLEIEQQEARDEFEERDYRAKGLTE